MFFFFSSRRRHTRSLCDWSSDVCSSDLPAAALVVLALQGAVMVALGAALVVVPEEVGSLWPWPLTPLTGRAVGTFVLAQGVLVLSVCRERDWDRVRPAMLQYLLLGALHLIALARFSGTPDWDRRPPGSTSRSCSGSWPPAPT